MKTELEKIFDAFHTGDYTHLLDYMHFRTYNQDVIDTILTDMVFEEKYNLFTTVV